MTLMIYTMKWSAYEGRTTPFFKEVSASIRDWNKISNATSTFSRPRYPMKWTGMLFDQTGSDKSKMVVSKPRNRFYPFQRWFPCFWGPIGQSRTSHPLQGVGSHQTRRIHISPRKRDRNEIPTSIPMFSGSDNETSLLRKLLHIDPRFCGNLYLWDKLYQEEIDLHRAEEQTRLFHYERALTRVGLIGKGTG
jgi:hypothetical protein